NLIGFRTSDGGETWTHFEIPLNYGYYGDSITAVALTGANTATAVSASGQILHTADGGATWKVQQRVYASFLGVSFTDAYTGTVVGYAGAIFRITTGGETPQSQLP